MAKLKETSTPRLIYDALTVAAERGDDFMSVEQLVKVTNYSRNRVLTALHHMRKHNCTDVVINADGRGWWFLTPDNDNRIRTCDEHVPHSPHRDRRRGG